MDGKTQASEKLQPLFEKLERTKFTGELHIRLESGQPASCVLIHHLPYKEFDAALLAIDPFEEFEDFTLKP